MFTKPKPKVELGQLYLTHSAKAKIDKLHLTQSLNRHENGDWGDVTENDRAVNEAALKNGNLLLSVYEDPNQNRYYIKTNSDRTVTEVLLPHEY